MLFFNHIVSRYLYRIYNIGICMYIVFSQAILQLYFNDYINFNTVFQ